MKVKLSDAFDLQMGKTPSRNDRECWGDGHKWISISDIGNAGKYIDTTKEEITDIGASKSGIKVVPKGTVIMSFKLSIGKTAITAEDMYTNEAIMAFINKGKYEIDTDYLYHMCKGIDWFEGTNKAVLGLTLNKATMSEKEIEIPPLDVQLQVVAVLDKVDELISLRKEQLAKMDQLVKSRFIELFGDPIANPKKWEADDMKTICTKITDGEHGSVVRVESGNVFLNAKHIKKDGTIDWKTVTYTTSEVHRKIYARCNPEPGDILLTTTGTIGNVAIVPNVAPFSMDRGITLLKLDRGKVNSNFVAALLNFECIQNIMNANVHASAIGHLFLNQVMRIPVVIPPMELQNQFAAFVEQTDKSKLAIQQSLDKLELLKKSLMQEYFG